MAFEEDIQRVKQKLKALGQQRLFTPSGMPRRFELEPPIREGELGKLEREFGIRLPEDFRQFVLLVGNGGAGPYSMLAGVSRETLRHYEGPSGSVASPCTLRPGAGYGESIDPDADPEFPGVLYLGMQTCGSAIVLVLNGDYRGRVVYVDEGRSGEPYFVQSPRFLSWYEWWLDEQLQGVDSLWFGYGMRGTEEELRQVLQDATMPVEGRKDAMTSLYRLRELRPETAEVLKAIASDSDSPLQDIAVKLLAKRAAVHPEWALREPLAIGRPFERVALVRALATARREGWVEVVKKLLWDDDPEVVEKALRELSGHRALTEADVEAQLLAEDVRVRRYALVAALGLKMVGKRLNIPVVLLSDADPEVQMAALRALPVPWSDEWVGAVSARVKTESNEGVLIRLAKGLGESGNMQAETALKALEADPRASIHVAARRARAHLLRQGNKETAGMLGRFRSWLVDR